jgi:hypothetical protein
VGRAVRFERWDVRTNVRGTNLTCRCKEARKILAKRDWYLARQSDTVHMRWLISFGKCPAKGNHAHAATSMEKKWKMSILTLNL